SFRRRNNALESSSRAFAAVRHTDAGAGACDGALLWKDPVGAAAGGQQLPEMSSQLIASESLMTGGLPVGSVITAVWLMSARPTRPSVSITPLMTSAAIPQLRRSPAASGADKVTVRVAVFENAGRFQ